MKKRKHNVFERLVRDGVTCDLCDTDAVMIGMFGTGWDNDRLMCSNKECQAEHEFATSSDCFGVPGYEECGDKDCSLCKEEES